MENKILYKFRFLLKNVFILLGILLVFVITFIVLFYIVMKRNKTTFKRIGVLIDYKDKIVSVLDSGYVISVIRVYSDSDLYISRLVGDKKNGLKVLNLNVDKIPYYEVKGNFDNACNCKLNKKVEMEICIVSNKRDEEKYLEININCDTPSIKAFTNGFPFP